MKQRIIKSELLLLTQIRKIPDIHEKNMSRIAAAHVVTIIKPILLVVVLCHGFVISPRYFSIWLVMYFCNFCALLL